MSNITIFHWRDYKHPQIGGSTINILHVAEHFAKQGHVVNFLTEKHSTDLPDIDTVNGVTYHYKGNKLSQYIALPLYFLKNLKAKTDIVLEVYDAWPFLTPLLHKKVLMHISHIQKEEWSMEFGNFFGPILKHIAAFLLRTFYKNADIISISQSSVDSIVAEGIHPKSLSTIPVGIEPVIFTDTLPQKRTDRIICSTPGRLKSHKRVDVSIRLIAKYNTEMRPPNGKYVYFTIIGAGDHEPYLQNLVKELNMSEYITFHGRAPDDIKRDFLAEAHLHLQFSKREGWGMTVIEAAAQGAPTLCIDIPGLRDSVTEETGYLVKSEEELFERFPKVIAEIEQNSGAYQQRVTKGFAYAQQFRWEAIDPKWDAAISRVLEEQAPQTR